MFDDDALLSALLNSPQLVLVAADLDGRVLKWSDGAKQLYGYNREEVLGRPLSLLVPAERIDEFNRIRERVKADGQHAAFETVRLAKDGTPIAVEMDVFVVRDATGKAVGTAAVQRDLRRVHRAEVALTASEEELHARYAESPVAQSRVDLQGRVLSVNAAMEELLGRSAAELVGSDALTLYVESDRAGLEEALARLASGAENHVQQERTLRRPDGGLVPIVVTVTVMRDATGERVLAGTVEDVTALREAEAEVRESAARFEALLTSMPVTVFTYDLEGRCTSSRGRGLKLLGVDEGELVGAPLLELDGTPAIRDALRTSLAGGEVQAVIDLADRVWQCHYRPLRDEDGGVQGGIGIALDVTERVRVEREVRANEKRLCALLRGSDDAVFVVDDQGRMVYVSPAVTRVLGYEDAGLFWRPAAELGHPEDEPVAVEAWRRVSEAEAATATFTTRVRHVDGSWRWCEHVLTNLMSDPDIGGVVVNLRDVTERRRTQQELQRLTLHDSLTGLASRSLLLDRIQRAMNAAERARTQTGLLLLDLVGMARINGAVGQEGGDAVIRAVADRLRSQVRRHDSVARAGGALFAVLLEDISSVEDLRAHASMFMEGLQEPVTLNGTSVPVTLRSGSAVTPAADAGALLAAAERALATAGETRRGEVARPREEERSSAGFGHDAAELREGIAKGELRLHFQPVVRLESGDVVGAEALVRWQHPERGLLPPLEFIPLAERSGLVIELGEWVLRAACGQAAAWRAAGLAIRVGVNLSPVQLVGDVFPGLVRRVLAESGLPADQLVLEVTESALMDDPGAPAVLGALARSGVRLALDDFGTGYSSMTYLKRFPVHGIKIDRSFVAGLGRDPDDEAIVASIVSLARTIGKTVVAEGVETVGQLEALRALGADQGQGFLWSRALDAAAFGQWAEGRRQQLELTPLPPAPLPEGTVAVAAGGDEDRILALHAEGASLHTIAAALNTEGRRTPGGPRWTTTTVARAVARLVRPSSG